MGLYSDLLKAQEAVKKARKPAKKAAPEAITRVENEQTPAPSPEHDTPTNEEAGERQAAQPTAPPRTPPPSRTPRTDRTPPSPVRPVRRTMIRHPFEIYQDQIEALRQLAAKERMQGGVGSMSQMVRAAIDRMLAERKSDEEA